MRNPACPLLLLASFAAAQTFVVDANGGRGALFA
jgi:hypothetical protein